MWRSKFETDSLWHRVLVAKYGFTWQVSKLGGSRGLHGGKVLQKFIRGWGQGGLVR